MVNKISKEDYKTINGWYYDWGMPPMKDSEFPKLGFIYPGVAAGFLVQTDSMCAFLDEYISNKSISSEERVKAICEITESLLQSAKDLGFKKVLALTRQPAIKKYCDKYGFISTNYSVFTKEI